MFSFKNKEIKQLFQWDKDIVLVFDSKYINQEVHFSNNKKNALVKDIDENGEVSIPNSLLTENKPIEVYLFLDDNYTKERRILKIIPRPKPDDYVYTEEEIKRYEDLENRVKKLEDISETLPSSSDILVALNEIGIISSIANESNMLFTNDEGKIYVL